VVDFSVHMRCQAFTQDHTHCVRRGRQHTGYQIWLCWQHYCLFYSSPDEIQLPLIADEERMRG
jgi:hypothetical protein